MNREIGRLADIPEVKMGLVGINELVEKRDQGRVVVVSGRSRNVAIGYGMLGKVITPVGLGESGTKAEEIEKVKKLTALSYAPDIIIDLSIRNEGVPLYQDVIDLMKGPTATVPVYRVFEPKKGIDPERLFDEIEIQAESGVRYMVIHAAVTRDLLNLAKKTRPKLTCTSRGGNSIIRDMIYKDKNEGVYLKHFNRLLGIFKKYGVTLSLATSFRPATAVYANDQVHLAEFMLQEQLIKEAREAGVPVVLESLSHASLSQILEFRKFLDEFKYISNTPLGSLGPLGTDAAPGYDHAVMAATASFAYFHNVCHFVTPVTRNEHTGGVPKIDDIIEALRTIRASFRVGEAAVFPQLDRAISLKRGMDGQTCILSESTGLFPELGNLEDTSHCTRCGFLCPYLDE